MNHLFINRDYPPSSCPPGGIGTYVDHISKLLARHGETVHVIGQQWPGAPKRREVLMGGRLVVHRVPLDAPVPHSTEDDAVTLQALRRSVLPVQTFAWQAALVAESVVEHEGIDVIEAQEYEAPAFMLLLRRALGLTSARPVPLIVQIHTGTEFVFTHNEWPQDAADYLAATRLEAATIRSADALLCPSRFLGRIAESHYHLGAGSIEVLPYPVGENPVLDRTAETWTRGTILYVGRIEPRKGVKEWTEAAVAVTAADPAPRFAFIGADTPYAGDERRTTRRVIQDAIPAALRSRFEFFDFVPREKLSAHWRRARIAVVPSRWENFPNTCIEAMSSGLPVLVSPTGGMAEMVEDGRTGWIADGQDPKNLERALRRALATPPEVLARMGAAAAESIRTLCDNERTVQKQLAFRRAVVARRGGRSVEGNVAAHVRSSPHAGTGVNGVVAAVNGTPDGAAPGSIIPPSGRTVTPLEFLRATPRLKRDLVYRAVGDPVYALQWALWHVRRWPRARAKTDNDRPVRTAT